jgi:hypothetical protein
MMAGSVVLVGTMVLTLLTGCGGTTVEVRTSQGKVTSEVSDKLPTEEEIGIPIYPNARVDKERSGSVTTTTKEGTATFKGANLVTEDPYEEVTAWYEEKLSGMPGYLDMTMGQYATSGSALFSVETEKGAKVVAIDKAADGKTKISIASSTAPSKK